MPVQSLIIFSMTNLIFDISSHEIKLLAGIKTIDRLIWIDENDSCSKSINSSPVIRVAIFSRPSVPNPKFVSVVFQGDPSGPRIRFRKGDSLPTVGDWSPKSTAMFSRPGPSCLEGPDVIYASYSKATRREASWMTRLRVDWFSQQKR